MNILTLNEVKQALWNSKFRGLFPEYKKEIDDFLSNPDCSCNNSLIKKILIHEDRIKQFFPDKELPKEKEEQWKVINCNIADLQKELKKLQRGHKQIAIARYQDEVTVIVHYI